MNDKQQNHSNSKVTTTAKWQHQEQQLQQHSK
jgi:hypothetical protein